MTATRLNPEYASKSELSTLDGKAVKNRHQDSAYDASYEWVSNLHIAYSRKLGRLYVFSSGTSSAIASFNADWH